MARKMLLVPENAMKKLTAAVSRIDGGDSNKERSDLDDEMTRILTDKTLKSAEKWKLYQQVLHRYLDVKDAPIKVTMDGLSTALMPATAARADANDDDDGGGVGDGGDDEQSEQNRFTKFSRNIPVRVREKGRKMLEYLSERDVNWDENGLVYINNQPVVGSNITTLVADLLRPTSTDPIGWEKLGEHIAQQNVPKSMITNAKRRALIYETGFSSSADSPSLKKNNKKRKLERRQSSKTLHERHGSEKKKKTEQTGSGKQQLGWSRYEGIL
jgi:hypothetical protein